MKSILLIGLGRFGKHIALHLNHLGHQVMAVDTSEERVEAVLPPCYQCTDWRQYECRFLGISRCSQL